MSTKYGITKIHFANVLLTVLIVQTVRKATPRKKNKQNVPMYIYSLIYRLNNT